MAKKPRDLQVDANLVVVDETDDSSILFALVQALQGGPVAGAPIDAPPDPEPPTGGKRVHAKADIQKPAEDAIERTLDTIVEELKASGRQPKFEAAEWVAALQELWNHLARMKDAGYEVTAEAQE